MNKVKLAWDCVKHQYFYQYELFIEILWESIYCEVKFPEYFLYVIRII